MTKVIFVYTFFLAVIFLPACKQNKPDMMPMFEGNDLIANAQILRDRASKKAFLKLDLHSSWKLYHGYSPEKIDFTSPLLTGDGSGVFELSVADSLRSYFELVTEDGKAILSDKHLPMTGAYNLRDLGGIRTQDGRYVKWGLLFRSDDLSDLTPSDVIYLNRIPINSVVDFRSEREMKSAPDRLPLSVSNVYELPLNPGNLTFEYAKNAPHDIDFNRYMIDLYRELVSDSICINRYREFFQLLLDTENAPLIYHCSAGKDRTGMATVFVLYALGVEEDVIMRDYLLSNTYLTDKYAEHIEKHPRIEPALTVKPEYLEAALDKIREEHGSIDSYLEKVLGVNIAKLRDIYLY